MTDDVQATKLAEPSSRRYSIILYILVALITSGLVFFGIHSQTNIPISSQNNVAYWVICITSTILLSLFNRSKLPARVVVAIAQSVSVISAMLSMSINQSTPAQEIVLGIGFGVGLFTLPLTLWILCCLKVIDVIMVKFTGERR